MLYPFLVLPMRATCHAQFSVLDLIALTIFGVQYKLRSLSLPNILKSPINSYILGPDIPFGVLPLQLETKFHSRTV